MSWERAFSVGIRLIFVFAFGAFLYASIHHIAIFFHSVEPATNTDMTGSYALAISVDGTALLLTIGVMFFSKKMERRSKVFIWLFIIGLTGFSWVVNWEYAVTYQSTAIIGHLDPVWTYINPVLASSFAFLNLAYSIVAEVFNAKEKSVDELQAELDGLTGTRALLLRQIQDAKKNTGPGFIEAAKQAALEVTSAAKEVIAATKTEPKVELNEHENEVLAPALLATPSSTDAELDRDEKFHEDGTEDDDNSSISTELDEEPFEELTENEFDLVSGTENGTSAELKTERITGKLVPQDGTENGTDTDPKTEAISVTQFRAGGTTKVSKSSTSDRIARRKPMTVEEVASTLNISERQVRKLRSQSILIQDDSNLITVSSVNAYLQRKVKVS